MIIPDEGYLYTCQEICKKNNVLFILDEIQTGMGRTGKNFAKEHYGLDPDGMTLGKSLGGGVFTYFTISRQRRSYGSVIL